MAAGGGITAAGQILTNRAGTRPRLGLATDEARARARRRHILSTDFQAIYELYQRRVFLWCLRIARNVEDAEDLTQDAFLLLFRKINTYRGESAFSTWLYRLATNISLMRLRRKTFSQVPLDEVLDIQEGAINPCYELRAFDLTLAALIARVDLGRALPQMPGGFKTAFFLHDSEDYSHSEIAELTGWSTGTSKSQLHKARRWLRQLLNRTTVEAKSQTTRRKLPRRQKPGMRVAAPTHPAGKRGTGNVVGTPGLPPGPNRVENETWLC